MRNPTVIESEISILNEELMASRLYYNYELVFDSNNIDDMIGCFNLGTFRKLMILLNNKEKLQYYHKYLGTVNVYMNPQCNRILVSENKSINEDNIISFMTMGIGEWYVGKINK